MSEIKLWVQRNRGIKCLVCFIRGKDFDTNKVINSMVGKGENKYGQARL